MKSKEVDCLPVKGHLFIPAKEKSAVFLTENEVLSEAECAKDRAPVAEHPVLRGQQKEAVRESHGDHGPEKVSVSVAEGINTEFIRQDREARRELGLQGGERERGEGGGEGREGGGEGEGEGEGREGEATEGKGSGGDQESCTRPEPVRTRENSEAD